MLLYTWQYTYMESYMIIDLLEVSYISQIIISFVITSSKGPSPFPLTLILPMYTSSARRRIVQAWDYFIFIGTMIIRWQLLCAQCAHVGKDKILGPRSFNQSTLTPRGQNCDAPKLYTRSDTTNYSDLQYWSYCTVVWSSVHPLSRLNVTLMHWMAMHQLMHGTFNCQERLHQPVTMQLSFKWACQVLITWII